MSRFYPRALCALTLILGLPVLADEAASIDYGDKDNWLCRPDHPNHCAQDLTTTIVRADGSTSRETFTPNPDAPVDCFYVYPTVSRDTTPNSDMNAGHGEINVIRSQFARLGAVCRTFAPLYRQVTLTALRANLAGNGEGPAPDRNLGYDDVLNAWNHYLENDNNGRGVVLVGHSQGSGVLSRMIANEIEGKPIQDRIISAMILGSNVQVPTGKLVGGTFKQMPLCEQGDQIGCVVTYASFRGTVPPPANSLFGRGGDNTQSACTNPAQLAKGSNELHAYLSNSTLEDSSAEAPTPWAKGLTVDTPFVSVPGLLTAACVSNEHGSYLEISVHGKPDDPRADDISGDVISNGEIDAGWGLHLIDVNLAMGDLVSIVEQQSKTYLGQ